MARRMMILLAAGLLAFSTLGCGCNLTGLLSRFGIERVRGSGNVVEQDHDVSDFTGVDLATMGLLTIEMGDDEALRIEAEDNFLPYFEIEVREGTLVIGQRDGVVFQPTEPIRFHLTVKELDALGISGAGNIEAPELTATQWEGRLLAHPVVGVLALAVDERAIEVSLAEQDYKPRFGMEVAYGARGGEDMDGNDRPDFLSVGLTFDLPLFAGNRQDRRVSAARHMRNAAADQRLDRLRELKQQLADTQRRRDQLLARLALFESSIVPASGQAAQAALAGYGARSNDFAEVMRAFIAELDARIELQGLRAGIAGTAVELRYLAGLEG